MMFVSIIIAIVSGKESLRRCLEALLSQVDLDESEIIVPYDTWSADVCDLVHDFPDVCFHFITDPGALSSKKTATHQHRLYDRRRAVGLALARGHIVALTEDHAVPAADWYSQIRATHQQPYAVIGGLIDNGVDNPLNWALYYCDFGRYGGPRLSGEVKYVSDVNVTYKRNCLEAIASVWIEGYHETTVHWALESRGERLFLDTRLVVYQHRPIIGLRQAYRERIEWGRVFAETRVAGRSLLARVFYAAGTPVLPGILLFRIIKHMLRQGRTVSQIGKTVPLATFLLTGWALGELTGYLMGKPGEEISLPSTEPHAE
jgi:hypothetical protein